MKLVLQDIEQGEPDGARERIAAAVMPIFSTWVYQCAEGPVQLNEALEHLARRLMRGDRNAGFRTNCGGWHYAFDLFDLPDPVVTQFRAQMETHVRGFLDWFHPHEVRRRDQFRLEGWININRAGDHNLLHCHPGSFLSAVYYVGSSWFFPPGSSIGSSRSRGAASASPSPSTWRIRAEGEADRPLVRTNGSGGGGVVLSREMLACNHGRQSAARRPRGPAGRRATRRGFRRRLGASEPRYRLLPAESDEHAELVVVGVTAHAEDVDIGPLD